MVYTRENSLMAKGWHHVAFVLYDMKTVPHACPVEVYIDGELQALTVVGQDGQDTLPLFDELRLGLDFNGKVDGLRVWKSRRTQQELRDNRLKRLRMADGQLPLGLVSEYLFDEGPGNAMATSGGDVAPMVTARREIFGSSGSDALWVRTEQFLDPVSHFRFVRQVFITPLVDKEGEYEVLFEKGSAARVKGSLRGVWPGLSLSYIKADASEDPITADTEFDFGTPVKVKVSGEFFLEEHKRGCGVESAQGCVE